MIYEPRYKIFIQNCMCAQRRHRSACASAQSDQSLCCLPEDILDPWLCPAKTLIRLRGCAGWSESSLNAHAHLYELLWPDSNLIYDLSFFLFHSAKKVTYNLFSKSTIPWTFSLQIFFGFQNWLTFTLLQNYNACFLGKDNNLLSVESRVFATSTCRGDAGNTCSLHNQHEITVFVLNINSFIPADQNWFLRK